MSFGGHAVQAAVKVKDATADRAISFNLDVMPVFMRSGCNTGSCHGAARGKDGFRLSLFGFDPAGDHFRLTREIPYRRINLAVPVESLLLEKTDGTVPHTGGKRYGRDSELYATLLRWLEAGAPYDAKETPKVVEVELYPKQIVLEGEGATQQMVARAKYADGTDRDVTDLAVFLTNNDNSAPISPEGLITAANRGEAFVMARFETHTVGSQALVLAQGPAVLAAARAPAQLRRRTGERQAAKAALAAQRTVQRRDVLASRYHRHRRRAADGGRVSAVHRRPGSRPNAPSSSTACWTARSFPRFGR